MRTSARAAAYRAGAWDLSDLGTEPLDASLARALRRARAFARLRGRLSARMSAAEFARTVSRLESVVRAASLAGARASLAYAADTQSDVASSQAAAASRFYAQVSNLTLFFEQWWKLGIDARSARRLAARSGELEWHLGHMRAMARYALSEPEERVLNVMEATGSEFLARLYDRMTATYEYSVRVGRRRRTVGREAISALVRDPRAAVRRGAYCALLARFSSERGVLSDIYSNVVSEWAGVSVGLRGHDSPISARNASNGVDDETVDALLRSCRGGTAPFRAFFTAKARALGARTLSRYDLYAPLSARPRARLAYGRAVRTILGALGDFDAQMGAMARRVFDDAHVDAEIRRGKRDGAFCSSPGSEVTPYILMSYTGAEEDAFTLAHELGHAVHAIAAERRSPLVQDAPLPLAEMASTFSEMLLYDRLAGSASGRRLACLASSRLDSLYATIVRQSFFTLFEQRAHDLVAAGSTAADISAAYSASLREQFGRSVDVARAFSDEWVAIPHFYHSPFYCYSYAFGNLAALSLFGRYKREGAEFARTYMSILAAGGSKKPEDLMAGHGFEISRAAFWREGLAYAGEQARSFRRLV